MDKCQTFALKWHLRSDHARDGASFGSPTCNCLKTAERVMPFLAEVWEQGYDAGEECILDAESPNHECIANPYREARRG